MKELGVPCEHSISIIEARLMTRRVFKVAELLARQLPELNRRRVENRRQNCDSQELKYRETSDQYLQS
jgi:hypothetical protein